MSENVDPNLRTIDAQTIKLLFGPSNSGKSRIMVEDGNMFIVNLETFQEVLDRKITALTFRKGKKFPPMEGKDEMVGWRPTSIEGTKLAKFELEAIEIEAETRLTQAKVNLRKIKKEYGDEA